MIRASLITLFVLQLAVVPIVFFLAIWFGFATLANMGQGLHKDVVLQAVFYCSSAVLFSALLLSPIISYKRQKIGRRWSLLSKSFVVIGSSFGCVLALLMVSHWVGVGSFVKSALAAMVFALNIFQIQLLFKKVTIEHAA